MPTMSHSRIERRSGVRNTELVAGALVVMLLPALAVKFLFTGSRISLTAINFIQLAIAAGLLNLTVHVAAKAVRWARASTRESVGGSVRRRRSRSHASAGGLPALNAPKPTTPPESRVELR
jgi:hypothetical protein